MLPPANLFRRFDELDVLLQQLVDQFVERGAARLGALGQIAQDLRVEMHRRNQLRVAAKELPALGFGAIVFFLHGDLELKASRKGRDIAWCAKVSFAYSP